ncbi:MAG: alpha/beta hydrolase [Ruminococcus sp.]|nr:alpha/beta hydrolase [Ruminococcus sp.]
MARLLVMSAVIVGCVGFGALAVFLITRIKKLTKRSCVLVGAAFTAVALGAVVVININSYYHAEPEALSALDGTPEVTVTRTDTGWFFDGSGSDTAIIFYPGAFVEASAYASLMCEIAAGGADCFLVEMPLNIALLGKNKADSIIGSYEYKHWYIAGHSMGGAAAAYYCADNGDKLDGLILLAAYSVSGIGDDERVLSVYGTNDKVLDLDSCRDNRKNLPDDTTELVIDGGNHAQFGCYGKQSGDGDADISPEEQRRLTVKAIIELVS